MFYSRWEAQPVVVVPPEAHDARGLGVNSAPPCAPSPPDDVVASVRFRLPSRASAATPAQRHRRGDPPPPQSRRADPREDAPPSLLPPPL